MLIRRFLPVLVLALAAGLAGCSSTYVPKPATPVSTEPPNLGLRKKQILAYVDSGDYSRDIAAVALEANKHLAKRAPKLAAEGKKLAIVFDIDETTLANYPHIRGNDFGYLPAMWDSWVAEARAHAIIPVQTVYDTAVRMKIAVFFITGRAPEQQAVTEKNLRDVGYDTWAGIYFMPTQFRGSTRGFKTMIRRKLADEGYYIIANLGDQESDLEGGNAERTFKLPNPFYLVY